MGGVYIVYIYKKREKHQEMHDNLINLTTGGGAKLKEYNIFLTKQHPPVLSKAYVVDGGGKVVRRQYSSYQTTTPSIM